MMHIDTLIDKYKDLIHLAVHKSGCNRRAEVIHGEEWCKVFLADLQKLKKDINDGD